MQHYQEERLTLRHQSIKLLSMQWPSSVQGRYRLSCFNIDILYVELMHGSQGIMADNTQIRGRPLYCIYDLHSPL